MTSVFELSEYSELLALHRALMEAKFSFNPNDVVLLGSPYLAKISTQLVETIIRVETEKGEAKAKNKWTEWRRIDPSRREWKVALNHAKEYETDWLMWSEEQKVKLIVILLSPFTITDSLLKTFIQEVNELI